MAISFVSLVPTVDTSIYTANDVLFASTRILSNGALGKLEQVVAIDKVDQAAGMELFFTTAQVAAGSLNGACAISDADALNIVARVTIGNADFVDLGGCRVAYAKDLDIMVPTPLWVFGLTLGTPTYAAATDLKLTLGFSN